MPESDIALARILWDYMRYEEPLGKADIIMGLGSHDLLTAEWSAQLYRDNYAPLILFCGGRGRLTENMEGNEADRHAETAIALGVPESAILRETASTNTGQNITNAYNLLEERNEIPKRVILVTKPYMLRRAYATFMKQWPSVMKPQITCSATDRSFENYGNGAETLRYTTNIMVGDLQRIDQYPKLGFQIEQAIPANVWDAYETLVARGYIEHLIK